MGWLILNPTFAYTSVTCNMARARITLEPAAGSFICLCCFSNRYKTGSRQKEFRSRDHDLLSYVRLLWVKAPCHWKAREWLGTAWWLWQGNKTQGLRFYFFFFCDGFNLNKGYACLTQFNLSGFLYPINHWLVLAPHTVVSATAESCWDDCLITGILMTCYWILCKQWNT